MAKIAMASLGCSKNTVDAEKMLASLVAAGHEIEADENEAEIIIVNTCCFIEDAKTESIDAILELAQNKENGRCRHIIVSGCMAERYREEVLNEMPEVDIVLSVGGDIVEAVESALGGERRLVDSPAAEGAERVLTTPPYSAYLKIAEGCDNRCTYCIIPSVRGVYTSRRTEDILAEARMLAERGVCELILVAQDTTAYGIDLYGEYRLPSLLRELCRLDFRWVRVLYCYPERITDELIEVIRSEEKICKYLDMPIQHCNDEILRLMARRNRKEGMTELIGRIRESIPEVVLRTSLIAGFPGEREEQLEELCDFIREIKFDRLGVFAYSQEEGTPAALLEGQIDEEEKRKRQEAAMLVQDGVLPYIDERFKGRELEVLTEGFDSVIKMYYGRSYADAPDIDGKVFFTGRAGAASPGEFVQVYIEDAEGYDLFGVLKE